MTVTQCHLARRDVRLVCPVGVWREVIAVAQMARRGTCEGRYVWRVTTAKVMKRSSFSLLKERLRSMSVEREREREREKEMEVYEMEVVRKRRGEGEN